MRSENASANDTVGFFVLAVLICCALWFLVAKPALGYKVFFHLDPKYRDVVDAGKAGGTGYTARARAVFACGAAIATVLVAFGAVGLVQP